MPYIDTPRRPPPWGRSRFDRERLPSDRNALPLHGDALPSEREALPCPRQHLRFEGRALPHCGNTFPFRGELGGQGESFAGGCANREGIRGDTKSHKSTAGRRPKRDLVTLTL
jgi:hypothetical protein